MPSHRIHREIAKCVVTAAPDPEARVTLYARATITITVFHLDEHASERQGSTDIIPLETMLDDAQQLGMFNSPNPSHAAEPVTSSSSGMRYVPLGNSVSEVLVGGGDLSSASFPALDMAMLSMAKGEKSLFATRKQYGYSSRPGDLIFCVEVVAFSVEVDLTPPTREITKHIVHREVKPFKDAYGLDMPMYGATVECTVLEVHPFFDRPVQKQTFNVEVGGIDHEPWLDMAVMSMQKNELATVRVMSSGAIHKIRLVSFHNIEPPKTIDMLIRRVEALKMNGNDLINRGHRRAHAKYEAGIFWLRKYAPELIDASGEDPNSVARKLRDLEVALEGNLTQALLTQNNYIEALQHANAAISLDATVFKNVFRRAKAKRGLKRYQDALMDVHRAQMIMEDLKVTNPAEWKTLEDLRTEIEAENS